jgi:hypothetical protein
MSTSRGAAQQAAPLLLFLSVSFVTLELEIPFSFAIGLPFSVIPHLMRNPVF